MKKRILFVIDSLTCGGAEKSLVSLLPLLDKNKYDLYIWIRQRGGVFETLLPLNIHIVDQPKYNAVEAILKRIGQLLFSFILRWNRFINKHEHLAETLWKCQGWAMKVPKGKWNTVVAYQQGVPTYLVAKKFHDCKKLAWINADILKAGYNMHYNLLFYQQFDCICPVSDELNKMLCNQLQSIKSRFLTVWDIINQNMIRKLAQEPCNKLKQDYSDFALITTGRLVVPKGYDIAIEAASFLKQKGISFKWYFIGEGDQREAIEAQIQEKRLKENVFLLGLQTNPYKYMAQADVYVQTSKFEGFGMTIAEAKILGKPVVSTNFDVVYNQIKNGKNGLIAEMNGQSVAECIIRLITDSSLRSSIIENVRNEKFTTYITEVDKVEKMLDK